MSNRIVHALRTGSAMWFVLTLLLVPALQAQESPGTLSGQVVDSEGMPLPGVAVTAISPAGNRTAYTDAAGRFVIEGLPPAPYDVSIELSGFVTLQKTDVQIQPGANELSFTMKQAGLAELIVVTASRVETALINAPATVSVVDSAQIEASPAQNYADLLRTVPGLNVTQTSARDINLTSRQANSTLATSQLALLDGRTIYLDFFGFIAWDFMPVNFNEIKQVEVIRGPASAVWGANAQTGVVNIITKTPRENPGTSVTVSAGVFDRDVENGPDQDSGTIFGANFRYADILNDTWSYKLSGGYFNQDPLPRPAGLIPVSTVPGTNIPTGGVPYSLANYNNQGTSQPKFDARVDQEIDSETRITYAGGVAGTDGIIHTGIGPFDIQSGTVLGYGKVNYNRGNFKLNFFTNILDGDAINQFGSRGPQGPIELVFKNQTYDFEAGHSLILAEKHILSFGGNYRRNNFEISIAPGGEDRNEVGGYIQDEFFTEKFRLVVGGRIDKFSVIDDPVFSPRVTAMFKPRPEHSLRASFNRAFRSPSQINNFLNATVINAVPLPGVGLFVFPTIATGNQDLKEEETTAWEVGYTGEFENRTTVGVAYYINNTDDNINFTPFLFYSPLDPPPGWPLPPAFVPPNTLPREFTYLNLGPLRQQGIEFSVDQVVNSNISAFANYSYQNDPEIIDNDGDEFPVNELIFPPNHRFNVGMNYNDSRFLGSVTINYTSEAFWTDVLDARFHGPTEAFTMVNTSFGVRWLEGRMTTTLKITNLFNEQIQQHIFGDILKRSLVGEVRFDF